MATRCQISPSLPVRDKGNGYGRVANPAIFTVWPFFTAAVKKPGADIHPAFPHSPVRPQHVSPSRAGALLLRWS